jgi:hypothetical protein
MRTISGVFCASVFLFVSIQQGNAGSICAGVAGNLVVNCGFETGDFTGWTLSGNDVPGQQGVLYGVEAGQDPDGNFPNSGNDQAFFGDLAANATTLSQTLATIPGGEYTVALFLAQDTPPGTGPPPDSNEFDVTLDGVTVDNFTAVPEEGYTEYTDTVQVTDSSSVLDITLGNDLGFFLLDDVSVATPEPSAWTLAIGGAALGFAFRRKLTNKRAAR